MRGVGQTETSKEPADVLQAGIKELDAIMVPNGFAFEPGQEGRSSRGKFAYGVYSGVRLLEGVVGKPVRVQIPPSAPSDLIRGRKYGIDLPSPRIGLKSINTTRTDLRGTGHSDLCPDFLPTISRISNWVRRLLIFALMNRQPI